MNLGVIIDGNKRFIPELLQDWRETFRVECLEFTPFSLPFLEGTVNKLRYRARLQSFLARNDVVFYEWAGVQLAYASHVGTRTALVARLHSWELFEFADQVRWDAVSRVIVVSEAMRRNFLAKFPDQAGKVEVVYPGKSIARFQVRPRRFGGRIGMACDLTPIKRVYEMVLSLHNLTRKGYDLTLHLAGDPAQGSEARRYVASIERAIRSLGLQDRVVFHGWVSDPAAWLRDIDIFVSNSYWEGMQNALIEAMATGCYCLAHFWEGAQEALPSDHIFISPSELEDKIAAFIDSPKAGKWTYQTELRSIVEDRFNLPGMLATMRAILMDAAGGIPAAVRLPTPGGQLVQQRGESK